MIIPIITIRTIVVASPAFLVVNMLGLEGLESLTGDPSSRSFLS